jgi:hypothetical protein
MRSTSVSVVVRAVTFINTPKMKTALTQKRFWDIKEKEKNVTDKLHAVPLYALDDYCSVKHLQRCETCVAVKGDYWHGK